MNPWFGVFAPAATPAAVVDKIAADFRRVQALPEVRSRLADIGAEPLRTTPAEFAAMVRQDVDKWGRLVKELGISAD